MAGGGACLVLGLIAVVFLQHAAAQTVHVVGDATGWTNQIAANFYSNWAASKTFVVGDSLQFNFVTNAHDVLEIDTQPLFNACTFSNTDNDIMRTSPVMKQLDEPGMHYFVCTIGSHCSMGQKLSINVSNGTAGVPSSPGTPPSTPSSPSPPSTPSSPSPPSSPTPPSPSSSNAVIASFYFTLLSAVVMSLFYI